MQEFPWWTDTHKKLAEEVRELADRLTPLANKLAYEKKFPWPIIKEAAKKGYLGAMIPKKYGGHLEEWGVTGACIIVEELAKAGEATAPLCSSMIGSIHQILHFGSEEQKQRWFTPLATGEKLGAITITEPFVGSDASGIRTKAKLDGDHYVINGKKRFIGQVGAAEIYMAYVATSEDPEEVAKHRHLTALVVEKGTPGFSVERVADLVAFDGINMGYLNFDNVRVPLSNRLGGEGEGWKVMTSGLNAERCIAAAQMLGWMRESISYAVFHMKRRLQFRQPTYEIPTNQFKVSEMISKLILARLTTFYTAHLIDLGQETPLESALTKLFNSDSTLEIATEAIQCMGGDGLSNSYPVARRMRDSKLAQIVAGTQEINKLLIFRQSVKLFEQEFKVPRYDFDEELNIPMPSSKITEKEKGCDGIIRVLAEYYRVHPGLHISREELQTELTETDLNEELLRLEESGLVDIYRDKKGSIALARLTYEGLAKAHQPEYYRSFPAWVNREELF